MKWVKTDKKVFVSITCHGEICWCGKQAVRKIGEEIPSDDPKPIRHNFTAYVCAECYANVLGPAAGRDVGLIPELAGQDKPLDGAEFMTEVLQMNIGDLPAKELDMPVIDGDQITAAFIKFQSDGGDHDEVLADRFEAVLSDLGVMYIRTTPRVITGDLSRLPGVVERWKK